MSGGKPQITVSGMILRLGAAVGMVAVGLVTLRSTEQRPRALLRPHTTSAQSSFRSLERRRTRDQWS